MPDRIVTQQQMYMLRNYLLRINKAADGESTDDAIDTARSCSKVALDILDELNVAPATKKDRTSIKAKRSAA